MERALPLVLPSLMTSDLMYEKVEEAHEALPLSACAPDGTEWLGGCGCLAPPLYRLARVRPLELSPFFMCALERGSGSGVGWSSGGGDASANSVVDLRSFTRTAAICSAGMCPDIDRRSGRRCVPSRRAGRNKRPMRKGAPQPAFQNTYQHWKEQMKRSHAPRAQSRDRRPWRALLALLLPPYP